MSLTAPSTTSRRYDLDWLRVIAFGLLIFYHIGMFYVTWDWHVKSPHAGDTIEMPMMLLNPWRLPLLFFISGIALRFVTDKGGLLSFTGKRTVRLLLPILFGMAVVVAPQSYFELRQAGVIEPGYLAFYQGYLSFDPAVMRAWDLIVPTWNHLWYVVYLLIYTWLVLMVIQPLRMVSGWLDRRGERHSWLILIIPVLPFILYRFTLVPHFETTHNLYWDWANHANSLTILMIGFVLANNAGFWRAVERALPLTLVLVAACAVIFSWFWRGPVWESLAVDGSLQNTLRVMRVCYAWWVILVLAGLAQRFLNRPSPVLTYLTNMVFAWYILHQTLTVISGYYLAQIGLPVLAEFSLVTIATIGGCFVGAEAIRRVPPLRPFFGMKPRQQVKKQARGDAHRLSEGAAPASS